VRGVIASSMRASSMLSVSARMSTKTGTAPRRTKALAVEGVGGRDEGVGGHDHLVTLLDFISQDRRHLQGCGAGVREQGLAAADTAFQPVAAMPGELSVAGEVPGGVCL